jgi:ABC-type transport system involved in multi-copper enzyme maturation permease subunit
MRPLFALIKREFTAYFYSPIAYAIMAVLMAVVGWQFHSTLNLLVTPSTRGTEFPMQTLLGDEKFWLVFLFIPALLTMRLIAEERGTGTIEALMTAPIRDSHVVLGKYIACILFYVVLWVPTLVLVPVLVNWDWAANTARIDPNPVITTYLGVLLAGMMFLALGLFVSSLVKNQLVAAVLALAVSLPFVVTAFWKPSLEAGTFWYQVMTLIGVPEHFRKDFCRGVVDTRAVVLYLSVTALCLFLTIRSLEARRLR